VPAARIAVLAIGIALLASPADAGDSFISEIRGGVFIDGLDIYPVPIPWLNTIHLHNLNTVGFDILFRSPEIDAFRWIGSPRPTLGVTLNLARESMVHAGLTWRLPMPAVVPVFVEFEFGGALHNGALSGATAPWRNLGCQALLYASFSVGWEFPEGRSLMLTEQHASHWGTCGVNNEGLNYIGIRLGQKM